MASRKLTEYLNSCSEERKYLTRPTTEKKTKTFSTRTKSLETTFFHTLPKKGVNVVRKSEI